MHWRSVVASIDIFDWKNSFKLLEELRPKNIRRWLLTLYIDFSLIFLHGWNNARSRDASQWSLMPSVTRRAVDEKLGSVRWRRRPKIENQEFYLEKKQLKRKGLWTKIAKDMKSARGKFEKGNKNSRAFSSFILYSCRGTPSVFASANPTYKRIGSADP